MSIIQSKSPERSNRYRKIYSSTIGTTVGGGATCGDGIGVRGSRAVLTSLEVAGRGTGGADGTAAAATGRAPGGVLWGTALSSRTPIVSPSYPRQLRYRWARFPRSLWPPCAARWSSAGRGSSDTSESAACPRPMWSSAGASASRRYTHALSRTRLVASLVSRSGSTVRMPVDKNYKVRYLVSGKLSDINV